MNLLKIAYRNVSRQKRRSNLLALAIAFGVMIIILVNSLTAGLIENTEKNFSTALGGHIYITGRSSWRAARQPPVSLIRSCSILSCRSSKRSS